VTYTGATPVFVDVQEDTCNIDPKRIEAAITKKTKLIIAVHLYGQPADMQEILAIAKKHKLRVLEDAAQAHGARYNKKRVGSLADIACFSFYPTKGLGGFGDGGMVVTSDKKLNDQVRMLRDYGRKDRYEHVMIGYNSRLDTVQAVVLSAKLKFLDEWNAMRVKHAQVYFKQLGQIKGLELLQLHSQRDHVYQTFAVKIPKKRDQVCEQLQQKGIGCLIHYPIPLHLQPAYKSLGYKKGDFPAAEKVSQQVLSLPMYPHMTADDIQEVCAAVKEALC
jgi:dTDP-4-amino-4,6-dideoxygalactose transaminase